MYSFAGVKAIMFDLDNTLIVRRYALEKLSRHITKFYFPSEPQRWAQIEKSFVDHFINGYDRNSECFELFKKSSGMNDKISYADFWEFWNFFYPYSTVRDSSAEAVLELRRRGYDTAILTNGKFVMQNSKIDVAGLRPWFSYIVTTQELGVEKPDVRAFHAVCDMLGLRPQQVAYVGDYAVNDIAGARMASMPTIWYSAYNEWTESIPRADAEIDSLWQLLDIFG